MGIFWDFIKTLFLVFFTLFIASKNQNQKLLWLDKTFFSCSCLWFQFPTREFSITWQDVCSYCFIYRFKIHNRVLITKMALTKLLEDTRNESSKLKICSTKCWDVWQNHSQVKIFTGQYLTFRNLLFCTLLLLYSITLFHSILVTVQSWSWQFMETETRLQWFWQHQMAD